MGQPNKQECEQSIMAVEGGTGRLPLDNQGSIFTVVITFF